MFVVTSKIIWRIFRKTLAKRPISWTDGKWEDATNVNTVWNLSLSEPIAVGEMFAKPVPAPKLLAQRLQRDYLKMVTNYTNKQYKFKPVYPKHENFTKNNFYFLILTFFWFIISLSVTFSVVLMSTFSKSKSTCSKTLLFDSDVVTMTK